MNGILVVNHFLNTKKYSELHAHLIKSAKKCGVTLEAKTNLELACRAATAADFALFWDKDINLARRIEKSGVPVFNSAESIALCDDKARTYIELEGVVPQPKTLIAPKTYFAADMHGFIEHAADALRLPLIFKECFGSFGEQVFLCRSIDEINARVSARPFILQEYIESSRGRDVRIEVVGGRCVSAVRRENKDDFRSNVTNGGSMSPYIPNEYEQHLALSACRALGLTFGGVDILDNRTVCEVNSNAHIINIMNATGTDAAPFIFDEIIRRIS